MAAPEHCRVLIIGAGLAGLGAAQRLFDAGIKDIIILEAQNRTGGRVLTSWQVTGGWKLYYRSKFIHSKSQQKMF